jgi:hypothetical protein
MHRISRRVSIVENFTFGVLWLLANIFAFSTSLVLNTLFVITFFFTFLVLFQGVPAGLIIATVAAIRMLIAFFCAHGFLFGTWISLFQGMILVYRTASKNNFLSAWILATVRGVFLGEVIGFISYLIFFLLSRAYDSAPEGLSSPSNLSPLDAVSSTNSISILLGAVIGGYLMGVAQKNTLKQAFYDEQFWPEFNAFGVAASAVIFIVKSKDFFMPKSGVSLHEIATSAAIAGSIYGIITGFALICLLKPKLANSEDV